MTSINDYDFFLNYDFLLLVGDLKYFHEIKNMNDSFKVQNDLDRLSNYGILTHFAMNINIILYFFP